MALEIVFTKRADNKLDAILDYLRNEWSLKTAETFTEHLYNILDIVSRFPDAGTLIDESKGTVPFS